MILKIQMGAMFPLLFIRFSEQTQEAKCRDGKNEIWNRNTISLCFTSFAHDSRHNNCVCVCVCVCHLLHMICAFAD